MTDSALADLMGRRLRKGCFAIGCEWLSYQPTDLETAQKTNNSARSGNRDLRRHRAF